MNEADEIVRELAEHGPVNAAPEQGFACEFCTLNTGAWGIGDDPLNHDPSCLWRRARTLYPS